MSFLVFRKIEKKYYFKTFIVFVGVAIVVLFGIYLANDFWQGTTLIYERQNLIENNLATVILSSEEPDTLVEIVPDNSLEEKTPIITEKIITKSKPVVTKSTLVKLKPKPVSAPAPVISNTPIIPVAPDLPVTPIISDTPVVQDVVVTPVAPVPYQTVFPGGGGGSEGGGGGGGGGSPPPAPDTTAPVITLQGDISIDVMKGDIYTDAGATALDDVDGDITANIILVNPVDTNTVETYTVTYNVSDAAGNPAIQKTRTINVIEPAGPPPEE
jgi:hypothetical protein